MEDKQVKTHQQIGQEQDLFLISQLIGSGLPLFTPKGTILRRAVEDFLISKKKANGYEFVWTPHIAKSETYHKSKHWGKYDAMFSPMTIEDEEYVVKPMNCPHHFEIYLNRPRSYRELPLRLAENGTVYRHEKSGEINGLFRVRSLTIDDTHTFIRISQTEEELEKVLNLIKDVLETFGFAKYKARISVSDPKEPDKYLGSRDAWEKAEATLKGQAEKLFQNVEVGIGEAAFYGPKIDIMVKDNLEREWQLSTVQLDYNQPENFDINYVDENGGQSRPAILHIATIGSLERFLGILIEHYQGKFPVWLSPVQVMLVPIADRHQEAAEKIKKELVEQGIRAEVDVRAESMQAKIRDATLQKVPFMGIIGDKEAGLPGGAVSLRTRESEDLGVTELSQLVQKVKENIDKKV
jgi:threonyl-tRNA synthetase